MTCLIVATFRRLNANYQFPTPARRFADMDESNNRSEGWPTVTPYDSPPPPGTTVNKPASSCLSRSF